MNRQRYQQNTVRGDWSDSRFSSPVSRLLVLLALMLYSFQSLGALPCHTQPKTEKQLVVDMAGCHSATSAEPLAAEYSQTSLASSDHATEIHPALAGAGNTCCDDQCSMSSCNANTTVISHLSQVFITCVTEQASTYTPYFSAAPEKLLYRPPISA
ncbi:hypothetical protein [Teredinibacter turnerae]|uniref:hypothetical protein n=1 Tax=Teredinibacter turnerae TaxID=2426 RepID=UPI000375183D|nr:hypothetical protein [Teredinibacter turnerae]